MARRSETEAAAAALTVAAVLVEWESMGVGGPGAAGSARAQIEALCAAGVHVVVASSQSARTLDAALGARPGGPGRLHLAGDDGEVLAVGPTGSAAIWRADPGEAAPPRAQVARWAAGWLAARGITGGLVLVVGIDPTLLAEPFPRAWVAAVGNSDGPPSAPAEVRQLLDEQLVRRRERRVPGVDPDPAWVVPLPEDPALLRTSESLGALANGWAGTRGAVEEDGAGTQPLFAISGVYAGNAESHLVAGPLWTRVDVAPSAPVGRRLLDLRTGVLLRTTSPPWRLRSLRFVSVGRPHALALRAEAGPDGELAPGRIARGPTGVSPDDDTAHQTATVTSPGGGGITVAARDRHEATAGVTVVERIAAWRAAASGAPDVEAAEEEVAALAALGFDELLAEHRRAWAERWAGCGVVIEGAPDDQLAARFAVFHLLAAAPDDGEEAALGARGLTGPAYGGHVFWDTEVYVLPALAALRPAAARALLEYRVRRLPAARAAALAEGHSGARFPWESAADGTDVTPPSVRNSRGDLVPIRTGEHEEHIVADVAWAACEYARWAGDDAFLRGPGRDLVVDGARWWASRIREDSAGRGHLYGVIGPDEYHEVVDDSAYTNVMARWNLRRGAALLDVTDPEAAAEGARFLKQAESLVDGFHPDEGLYEQFAGYWDLEPLLVADIASPPVAADVLLGAARVEGSQLIKQADVVLLHHLVPEEVVPGSLVPNLAYYEPRTAHGSSLSPAIHAALLARAGQPERALELFRLAARLDLDDITGTTPGGLHLATMGGVWQALAYGFLGLRPGHALRIDPCLPAEWHALGLRFRFRGQALGVHAEPGRVTVTCDRPVLVRISDGPAERCDPPGRTYDLEGGPPCTA